MIPHCLVDEEVGSELKNRVNACRKRMRYSRATQKGRGDAKNPLVDTQTLAQFPAESLPVRQLAQIDLSPVLPGTGPDSEGQELITQGVGVT